MSAPQDLRGALAELSRGLAAQARRATWRGRTRSALGAEQAAPPSTSAAESRPAETRAQVQAAGAPPAAAPGPATAPPIHNPPPTQGRTAPPPAGSPAEVEIRPSSAPAAPASPRSTDGAAEPAETAAVATGCGDLGSLAEAVAACQACPLHATRNRTVFQDGSAQARVLFIGEAPGADEDAQGVPFVGRAGRLLTDIIEKGMGLRREEVAIANVLKCRPPGNRDPLPAEKATCTPFLDRQIELIDPEVLIPLGRHAAQHVLGSDLSMGRLRGRIHALGTRQVVPTYHPAYLLRTPAAKKECWQDIQLAMGILGLEPPAKR